MLTSHSDLCAT